MTPRSKLVATALVIAMALPAAALAWCGETMIARGNPADPAVAGMRSSCFTVISSTADRNQCCELSPTERLSGFPLQTSTAPAVGTPAMLVFSGLNFPSIAETTKRMENPRVSPPFQSLLCTFLI